MPSVSDKSQVRRLKRNRYMREVYCKRTKRVDCVFSPDQYRKLKARAKEAGLAPSVFLREAAFAYLEKRYLVPANISDRLDELTALLRNMANNLNQIARHTNTIKRATVFNLIKARQVVFQFEETLQAFITYPSRDNQVVESQDGQLRPSAELYQQGSPSRNSGCSAQPSK